MGTSTSAHQGFIRGAIALHTLASSGQHRSPVCGPIAGASPVRIRASTRGISRDRPRCVVRSLLNPASYWAEGRKKILTSKGTPEQSYPRLICFILQCPAQHVPNYSASPRWLRRIIRTCMNDKPLQQHTPERFPPPGKPAHVSSCNFKSVCCG